jgi:hypothetical protein
VNNRPIISATLGSYQCSLAITAPLGPVVAAGAVLWAFRYAGANLCLVEKVILDGVAVTTAFTAGQAFAARLFVCRSYTASHGTNATPAATLTGNNVKLRTSYASTAVASIHMTGNIAGATGGTRTPDAQPCGAVVGGLAAAGSQVDEGVLFDAYAQGHPIVLANNEGLEVQNAIATPVAGTISLGVTIKWTEVTAAEWA